MSELEATLERLDEADWFLYREELRQMERWSGDDVAELDAPEFLRSDPGHPLGVGMPMGTTLRVDGESHLDAWAGIVCLDPCSYCARDFGGTLDHIAPGRGRHRDVWLNYTSACPSCNTSKKSERLLLWLARRHVFA